MFVSIAAGMAKVEVKNQHVQAGSTTKQQGVYATHFIPLCNMNSLIGDSGNKPSVFSYRAYI